MTTKIEWFGEWFSSPYYHILYKNRDLEEAKPFLDHLIDFLDLRENDRILDMGCGRGRHAIYLNQKGFNVTGIDLSVENIHEARLFQNEKLHFFIHDMRYPFRKSSFTHIFNFFTTFGYFDTILENKQVIHAAFEGLVPGGKLLLDFLNPCTVVDQLAPEEVKEIGGITFHITKKVNEEMIVKEIAFADHGEEFHFYEKVKAIQKTEFLEYFADAGFELLQTFGDYELSPYEAEKSDRMIFFLKK